VAFLLSLLSKEAVAASLPLLLLLSFFSFAKKELLEIRKNIKYYLPISIAFFAASAFYLSRLKDIILDKLQSSCLLILNVAFGNSTQVENIGVISYLDISAKIFLLGCRAVVQNLQLLLLPYNLSADYSFPSYGSIFEGPLVLSFGLFVSLLILIKKTNRYSKEVSFCLVWMLVCLVPVSNFIPLAPHFVAERYLYSPSVGFCLCLAIVIDRMYSRRIRILPGGAQKTFAVAVLAGILLAYSFITYNRNADWRSGYTLWSKTVQQNPKSDLAHDNLGIAYKEKGMFDEAIQEFEKAIEINPNLDIAHYNLGTMYGTVGMYDEAIHHLERSLEINPKNAEAYNNLGTVYGRKGLHDEAIEQFKRALEINPKDVEAYCNLGNAHRSKGLYLEAIRQYQKAINVDPGLAKAHYLTGEVLSEEALQTETLTASAKVQQMRKAIHSYEQFLTYWTGDPQMKLIAEEKIRRLRRAIE